jgi:hypothetical protein
MLNFTKIMGKFQNSCKIMCAVRQHAKQKIKCETENIQVEGNTIKNMHISKTDNVSMYQWMKLKFLQCKFYNHWCKYTYISLRKRISEMCYSTEISREMYYRLFIV